MTDVTATATGGTGSNYGVNNNDSPAPTMNNVTATATGRHQQLRRATTFRSVADDEQCDRHRHRRRQQLRRVQQDSTATIRNSSITGTTNSIENSGSSAQVADTALGGGNVAGGGFTCVGAYTTAFVALSGDCDIE